MKRKILGFTLGLALLGAVGTAPAQSDLVGISNLDTNAIASYGYDPIDGFSTSFTVGSGSWAITDLTINYYNTTGTADTIGLSLYSDNGGSPGSLVDSLGSQSTAEGAASPFTRFDLNFTQATPITLDAGATYWIVGSGGANDGWELGQDTTTGMSDWSMGIQKMNYAGNWYYNGPALGISVDVNTVTPAPEPSTMALAALGGLSLLVLRRRKS